ncbi:lysosome-associated membrane glycoprotein 1 [Pseudophryne corroboree]|uniref:lysosome-associated membrane glycoprotein 1 n=1 Tax=Pseudophryne corroboree TaxID=495146 RepID=UPI003081F018
MKITGQGRLAEAALGLALLLGIFQSAYSVKFEVTGQNITCILADLSINFTVEYKTAEKQVTALILLPENAATDPTSTCGKENTTAPLLVIKFGNGHLLSMNFTKSKTQYQVDELVFTYNLSDKATFPNAVENGTKEVSSTKTAIAANINYLYKCSNPHQVTMGNVNVTFYNVSLEAYLNNKTFSLNVSLCSEDTSPTSGPPVPPTTATPTTAPVNPQTPKPGDYRVNTTSGVACILAKMGLQLNITYTNKAGKEIPYAFNIDPNLINVAGTCTNSSAVLMLLSKTVDLSFNFTLNTNASKFYLSEVFVNASLPDSKDPRFILNHGNLSYLQATTHKSYKCNSKQHLQIASNFAIDTYSLQVQAFDIDENKFGPAVECAEDQNGMLVPIVVGACLAGLVLIVLIAYLIGRKRSHAGYQTI